MGKRTPFPFCQWSLCMRLRTKEASDAFPKGTHVHVLEHHNIKQTVFETRTGNGKFPLTSKNGRVDDGDLERTTTQRGVGLRCCERWRRCSLRRVGGLWHRQSLKLELNIQSIARCCCLQRSIGVGHTSEALARCHVGRYACKLHVDSHRQRVCEEDTPFGNNSCRYRVRLGGSARVRRVRGLLCRLCHANIYLLLSPLCDDVCCPADILRNMQSTCNIIGSAQWQYSQGKAAFGNVGNHASHQSIATCRNSHGHPIFFPEGS